MNMIIKPLPGPKQSPNTASNSIFRTTSVPCANRGHPQLLYRDTCVIVPCGLVGAAIVALTILPALTMFALFFGRAAK